MSNLKSLAKDTAIYGVSSILGKFINFLLVPLYTVQFTAESGGYGVVTNIYAIVALLQVILIYGMETGFFRFANDKKQNEQTVYSSILISIASSSLLFILLSFVFIRPISSLLGYADHPEYVGIMAIVVGVDAFLSIPFAYLRHKNKAVKFAGIRLFSIVLNIALNLFFLIACPWIDSRYPGAVSWFYNPAYQVTYVFVANLITSVFQIFFFIPELKGFPYRFDAQLMKRILRYSFPLLVLGIVGIFSQMADKIIYPYLFEDRQEGLVQLGIYSAAGKVAMVMVMFTQAFRYAYEPFVFGKNKEGDNRLLYARVMKFFIIFSLLAFLGVVFYVDILQYIIGESYREGLKVVPIVMVAEMFMGIYFNLSFWYKLIDETRWGAYFSVLGCVIIVALNVIFVPVYGYMASAWASVAGYGTIMVLSYLLGQKKYPIAYDLKGIGLYFLIAIVLYILSLAFVPGNIIVRLLFRTLLLAVYIAFVIKKDLPLDQIPLINRFIKKGAD